MISSFLALFYCIISLSGIPILIFGTNKEAQLTAYAKLSLTFFGFTHLLLLFLSFYKLFTPVGLIWIFVAAILIIASRILNGQALYGKNNWRHYLITGPTIALIVVLHLFEL